MSKYQNVSSSDFNPLSRTVRAFSPTDAPEVHEFASALQSSLETSLTSEESTHDHLISRAISAKFGRIDNDALRTSARSPPFFSLPFEIRLKIYAHLFASLFSDARRPLRIFEIDSDNQTLLRLMLVCKHMYYEVPLVVSEIVPVYIRDPNRFPHGLPPLFRNPKHVMGTWTKFGRVTWEPSLLLDLVKKHKWKRVWLYTVCQTVHPSEGDDSTVETLDRLKDALEQHARQHSKMEDLARGVPDLDMRIYLKFHSWRTQSTVAKVCLRRGRLYVEEFAEVDATKDEFGSMVARDLGFVIYHLSTKT